MSLLLLFQSSSGPSPIVVSDTITLTDEIHRTRVGVSDTITLTDTVVPVHLVSDTITFTDTVTRVTYGRVVFPWLEPADGYGAPGPRY
ncbi:MAG TPA: hypothetical protein VD926_15355 [Acidimicrobiales bacterium]|nr:hypothetical protein [Acidimicrobiales bacterium]